MSDPQFTFVDVLQDRWWCGAVAFAVSLVCTPVMRLVAYRTGVVDRPDALLKPHGRPIAYLGGVAICVGLLAGLAVYAITMPDGAAQWAELCASLSGSRLGELQANAYWKVFSIAAASLLIMLVGLFDDLYDIRPRNKILGQVGAAAILVVGGVGNHIASMVLFPLGLQHSWLLVPCSAVMLTVIVIGTCNATNLLDGLDGLCGGVTGIIALGYLCLGVWLAIWGGFPATDTLRIVLGFAMAGAVFGFLPYNIHPATIFMGDAGSMLLGLLAAVMLALFSLDETARWFVAAVAVFSLPILDTSLAVVRRGLAGRSLFAGDRSHLYDQLVDRGFSVRRVVSLFYAMSVLMAVVAIAFAIYLRLRYALLLYGVMLTGVWVLFARLGMIAPDARAPGEAAPAKAGRRVLTVLFTSAGRRVSLVREFRRAGEAMGIPLRMLAADAQPLAPALHVVDQALLVPSVRSGAYIDRLLALCREHHVDAVVPLIDPELRPLADAQDRFTEIGTRAVISTRDVVWIATDKQQTAEFLAQHGFRTPRILSEPELAAPTLPLFIKPRSGSSSQGAHKIVTMDDLHYYRRLDPGSIVQEFVAGVEYTVDVFADFAGRARCAVPRRRIEVRGGEVSKGQATRNERIMREACRVVDTLGGCRGMITIQCFLTPADEIVFIEINPRFGGGVPLSIRAGADSPRWLLELLLGREPAITMDGWTDGLIMLRYDEGIFALPADLPTEAPPAAPAASRTA